MKFKIGQRVKKVRGPTGIGRTGVYVGPSNNKRDPEWDARVLMDEAWVSTTGRPWPRDKSAQIKSHQWEPILDPGATPSAYSFSELLEGLRSGELVTP